MATLNLQVGGSTDDARSTSSGASFNATAVSQQICINASVDYYNGFRFTGVTIPQGATITSATLDLYSAGTATCTTALAKFHCEAVDNSTTWVTSTHPPGTASLTTAFTTKSFTVSAWTATGFGIDTVDVTTAVQEVINRVGWSSGNALSVIGHDNGSTNNNYIGNSTYDSNATRGAKLAIVYSTTTPPTAPTSLTATQTGQNIILIWTDNSTTEDGFTIEEKRGGSSNYYAIGTVGPSVTTFVDRYVDPGYTYTYRVKATSVTLGDSTYATSSSITASGTKRWTAQPMSWHYPDTPSNPFTEYSARRNWGLKPEYYTVNGSGVVGQRVASGPEPYG